MRCVRTICALLVVSLAACGGGGGGNTPPPPPQNQAPIANAGPDQTTVAGGTVTLNAAGSTDADGTIATFSWVQAAGPQVSLTSSTGATPAFCAPPVAIPTLITFRLTVTDNAGLASAAQDTVDITVAPHPGGTVAINGRVTFARVPDSGAGLAYTLTRQDPARAITIQAVCGGQQVLAGTTTTTDANGNYSLTAPANTPLAIRATAEIVRASPLRQVRVIDDDSGSQVHSFTTNAFDSSAPGGVQNLAVPSGFDPTTRTATGPRAAAPFAILDTVYKALLLIETVEPTADFPALDIDWGPQNEGGQTFYQGGSGTTPRIVLSGEANVDTDEYDEHVIAHEFGHYIEDQFSRSDSIGGPHGAGDRLDLRVAFGEGYGYAFGAIVLGESFTVDTFGAGQAMSGAFDVEQSVGISNPGWFSEASNRAILWDLFDATGEDPIELGFAVLWTVLTGDQGDTDAVTSIFSFIAALKAQNGGEVTGINQIVNAQSIVSNTIERYGSTETNAGGVNPSTDVLPIFTPIAVDNTARQVRSIGLPAGGNKLSGHRLLRFNNPATQNVRFQVQAVQAGRDVDIRVFRRGVLVALGELPMNEDFPIPNLPQGEYVLDVYDCQNAECADQASYNYAPTDIRVTLSNN